jgi:hypothetical protein
VTEASCDADGTCLITCEPPYEDCDGDPSNGCEVPVGVSAQCSMAGLDPNGCWTPYCGESSASDATNFGTYFCVSCSTCREPEAGTCSWCELATGQWYPTDPGCECGEFLGAVCIETPAAAPLPPAFGTDAPAEPPRGPQIEVCGPCGGSP